MACCWGMAEALMYYEVSPQPNSLESFPTGEKIHIERRGNDLIAEIMVESSPYSCSPRYAKMWCELNHSERKKNTHIYLRQAIWIYMLCNSLFRHILKPCSKLRKCKQVLFPLSFLYNLGNNCIIHFWIYNKNCNLAGFSLSLKIQLKLT